MACVNADGSLTSSALNLLKLATEPVSPEGISKELGTPLFKVRASLREMLAAGLVVERQAGYQTTEEGVAKLGTVMA